MENDLVRAVNMLDQDDRVKVIVVTGEGRHFCAGADLDIGLEREEGVGAEEHRDGGGRVSLAIHRCRKPTIAAIQGSAKGITMTLPMAIRVASSTAKIGFVFSHRGVVMEALFHHILPTPSLVLPKFLEIATQISTQTSTISTYLMREMMWRNPGSAEGTHLLDSQIMWELYEKEDKKEGVKAFLEKRVPVMRGTVGDGMPANVPWWEPIDTVPRGGKERTGLSKL